MDKDKLKGDERLGWNGFSGLVILNPGDTKIPNPNGGKGWWIRHLDGSEEPYDEDKQMAIARARHGQIE